MITFIDSNNLTTLTTLQPISYPKLTESAAQGVPSARGPGWVVSIIVFHLSAQPLLPNLISPWRVPYRLKTRLNHTKSSSRWDTLYLAQIFTLKAFFSIIARFIISLRFCCLVWHRRRPRSIVRRRRPCPGGSTRPSYRDLGRYSVLS